MTNKDITNKILNIKKLQISEIFNKIKKISKYNINNKYIFYN